MTISMKFTDNVIGDSVTASEGFARLGFLDVFLFGHRFGVAYGDMDPLPGGGAWPSPVSYNLTAQRMVDGVPAGPAFPLIGILEHGTDLTRTWGAESVSAEPHFRAWRYWYSMGLGHVPGSVLASRWVEPSPQEQTESTGSGLLHTMRSPCVLSMLHAPTPAVRQQAVASLSEHVAYAGLRGSCYYHSSKDYRPYLANADNYLGRGYAKAGGGFSTLFSSTVPPGIPPAPQGLQVPHATHLTIQALTGAAYGLGDYMALRHAIHAVQAVGTSRLVGEKWSSRAYGRFFLSMAEMAPAIANGVTGTENMVGLVGVALRDLTQAQVGDAPAPDNGKTAEGSGHLLNATVTAYASRLGITDPELVQHYAKSDASWFVTQLLYGLTALDELWNAYGIDMDSQSRALLPERKAACRDFLRHCMGQHLDATKEPASPRFPVCGMWAEVSAHSAVNGRKLAEGDGWGNCNNGVFPRFLLPVMAYDTSLHDGEWSWMTKMYDYCKQHGTWNGDYASWALENLPAVSVLGWEG